MKSGVKSKETRLFFSSNSVREFELFEFELPGFTTVQLYTCICFSPYLSLIYVAQRKLLVYQ